MSDDKYDILNATVQAAIDGEEPRIFVGDPQGGEPKLVEPSVLDELFSAEGGPEEEVIEIEWLAEGTEVSVTAPVDAKKPDVTLTLTGKIRGTSTLPMGFDNMPGYIVELDEPEKVPSEDGDSFEYTCIVFPIFIVKPIKKVDDNG